MLSLTVSLLTSRGIWQQVLGRILNQGYSNGAQTSYLTKVDAYYCALLPEEVRLLLLLNLYRIYKVHEAKSNQDGHFLQHCLDAGDT